MRSSLALLVAGVLALVMARSAVAHHSFAMFDAQQQRTLVGVVKEFQWTNPHTWIQLLVDDGKGGTIEWAIEGNSPNILVRQGYTSKIIRPGDKVTLVVRPLKDGNPGGSLVTLTLADGRVLGSNAGAASGKP